MRTRRKDRSRIWFPLLVGVGLFGIYRSLLARPDFLKDYRFIIDEHLLFLALIPLIFVIVRIIDYMVFDLLMPRRQRVVAPLLLREILDIVLYVVLFGAAVHPDIGGAGTFL